MAAKYDRYIFFKLLMNLESSGVSIPFWENVNISVPCLVVFYLRQTEKKLNNMSSFHTKLNILPKTLLVAPKM